MAEKIVSDLAGEVYFAWRARDDVRGEESLEKHAEMLRFWSVWQDWELPGVFHRGVVMFPIPLGVQREFQRLQAVVLREVRHESCQSIRGLASICQHIVQGRSTTRVRNRRERETDRPGLTAFHSSPAVFY